MPFGGFGLFDTDMPTILANVPNASPLVSMCLKGFLSENGFIQLNKSVIESPGLLSNEELEYNILHVKENYDYLLNLSYRKMNKESYENNT